MRLILLLALSSLAACAASPGTDPVYEKEMERARRAFDDTPESERQALSAKMNELDVFVRHLRCEGATQLPPPDRIKGMYFVKWPPTLSLAVEYPLEVQVQVEPSDPSAAKVYLAARQQAGDAPWQITEFWSEHAGGAKKDLGVPSTEIQQRINRDLPRLLREGAQAKNRWLWPACALAGR
jgi:hypothetical protein